MAIDDDTQFSQAYIHQAGDNYERLTQILQLKQKERELQVEETSKIMDLKDEIIRLKQEIRDLKEENKNVKISLERAKNSKFKFINI